MADLPPKFTLRFNFEQERWKNYSSFIDRVRNEVAVRYSHDRPVTPVEEDPPSRPTQFFDIILETNDHSFTMRVRRDNLYVMGYQMENSNQWLELTYNNDINRPHRIANSSFLSFGDTYERLTTAGGVATLTDIQVGRSLLISAINALATTTNNRTRARSIIVVLIMINESVRFSRITTYFSEEGRTNSPVPDWIANYVRGWATLSETILHNDMDNSFRVPRVNNFEIDCVTQAIGIIGILKGYDFGPPSGLLLVADEHDYSSGRPLVEFFSVTIDEINGNRHIIGDIYGKILGRDGLGDEYIYNRGTNGYESVRAGKTVLLNGPVRCISAYDSFTVDVTLMSRQGLSEDDEISKGKISWEVSNIDEYDKLLFQQIKGRFGSATLSYAVLKDAVEAMVEVTLVTNGEAVDLYGMVTSHNVSLNSESMLFRKAHNKFINVKPGELIPLSRSVVAVPFNSNLIVRADLKGSNIFSSDDEIAKGTATFSPQLSGTNEQSIYGNNNSQIRVKVTWSWYI